MLIQKPEISYWNTRIIEHEIKSLAGKKELDEKYYEIHEVYYNKKHEPVSWSQTGIVIAFEDEKGLDAILNKITDAREKSILRIDSQRRKLIDTGIFLRQIEVKEDETTRRNITTEKNTRIPKINRRLLF